MQDLKSSKAIWFKGAAFALIAIISSVLLLVELPTFRVAVLLALALWASCRAYYFAFYVIQHYVDPGFRFSGLGSFLVYALRKRSGS
jgi:hypothetical protein